MKKQATEFAALLGIDWADRKHDLCLWVPGSASLERSVLQHPTRGHRGLGRGAP